MSTFRALVVAKSDAGQVVSWQDLTEADLMPGDVTIRVSHTTINYKDGLAITGRAPVIRRWPMVPGIDFAGTVVKSETPKWSVGDEVILNGWGVGETHWGGYAGMARVKGDWLVRRPSSLSAAQAMAIGTAGYTAMLSVMALERAGVVPGSGPVLVTGAAGGVGSVAVAVLAKLGFEVAASTGRPEEADYLKGLGAKDILARADFSGSPRPLNKERWAGAIDVAGGSTLANVISQLRYGGAVAACGLAQSMDLPASVAPFILRGVSLIGIDSVMAPEVKRIAAWDRLTRDLDPATLDRLTVRKTLADVVELAPQILEGKIRGRVVLEVG